MGGQAASNAGEGVGKGEPRLTRWDSREGGEGLQAYSPPNLESCTRLWYKVVRSNGMGQLKPMPIYRPHIFIMHHFVTKLIVIKVKFNQNVFSQVVLREDVHAKL